MAKYLISFPSAAMIVPDGEWEAVGRDAHAVIDEAKAAGVYVFGGGIDEDVPPVLVSAQRKCQAFQEGRMAPRRNRGGISASHLHFFGFQRPESVSGRKGAFRE